MNYIINSGSMFFIVSLVCYLAYIDYSLCQIWSVYTQYLQCCAHSKNCLFPVVQQAEVLLNFFGGCTYLYSKQTMDMLTYSCRFIVIFSLDQMIIRYVSGVGVSVIFVLFYLWCIYFYNTATQTPVKVSPYGNYVGSIILHATYLCPLAYSYPKVDCTRTWGIIGLPCFQWWNNRGEYW